MTIAGAVYPEQMPEESATKLMLARSPFFPHRVWRDGPFELGHAREEKKDSPLQPISNLLILFDGNLYNREEIREEIQKNKEIGPSLTNEELIASLYLIHRENCFGYLNGNFALAIYDLQKQELVLARDRLGEKGLFWCLKNNLFLFAGSLKSILESRLIPQSPDLEALSFYVSFGFIPQEKSPIQSVFKLQPGHYLKVSKDKNHLIRPYWAFSSCLASKKNELTDVDWKLAAADAWKRRVSPSAPPFCHTSSEEEWDFVAKEAGVQIYDAPSPKILSSNTVFADLSSMIWELDEPVADLALPALWQTCKEMKAEKKTELFFSTGSLYQLQQEIHPPRLFFWKPLSSFERFLKQKLLIPIFYQLHPKTAYEMLRSIHTHPWHIAFLNQTALFDRREFSDLHSHLLSPVNNEIFLHRFPALERLGPSISSLLYLYHKIKLPPSILLPQERFCSHFGIIRKAPYLDVQMIELLASVPDASDRFSYAKLFKPGCSRVSPLPSWATEVAIRQLTEKFSKSVLVEAGLFSSRWLSEQMKNFNRHPHLFFQELWGLMVLEIWFRQFIERSLSDSAGGSV